MAQINLIHLTEAGSTLQQKATELVNEIVAKTLSNITEEELNVGRTVLKKILSNLN